MPTGVPIPTLQQILEKSIDNVLKHDVSKFRIPRLHDRFTDAQIREEIKRMSLEPTTPLYPIVIECMTQVLDIVLDLAAERAIVKATPVEYEGDDLATINYVEVDKQSILGIRKLFL